MLKIQFRSIEVIFSLNLLILIQCTEFNYEIINNKYKETNDYGDIKLII